MIVNTLERLIILVIAIVGLVFIYGTLSMAWAGCDEAIYPQGWAQFSKITGERLSPYHNSYDECMEEEQPKVAFPFRFECRRHTDAPTPIREYQ